MLSCQLMRLAIKSALVIGIWLLVGRQAVAQWATFRGDASRTGFADMNLSSNLTVHWRFDSPQPPRPAWPPPARGSYWQRLTSIEPRVVDDHAFHPVVAGNHILFGSSADDTLRSVNLETGKIDWQVVCEGPIRYAPAVRSGRVYWGSDDGYVYCVRLDDGERVWRRRLGPQDRRLPGNGRLISTWPIRTGVITNDDAVFAFAGLFPSQGVYAAALDLVSGEPVWESKIDKSPQGYLLRDGERLIVPMGRANPSVYSTKDGRGIGDIPGSGGTYALIRNGRVISGRGNKGELIESDQKSRARLAQFEGRQMSVAPERTYLLKPSQLVALQREPSSDSGKGHPQVFWSIDIEDGESLACTRNHVIVGGRQYLMIVDATNGKVQQRLEVDGRVLGLALSQGRLIASTDLGSVYCFGASREAEDPTRQKTQRPGQELLIGSGRNLAKETTAFLNANLPATDGPRRGFCVVAGQRWPELIDSLIDQTEYHIVAVESDPQRLARMRETLIDRGVYGSRVAMILCAENRLPLVSRIANLVIRAESPGENPSWQPSELRRILTPGRGVEWSVSDNEVTRLPARAGVGKWTHLYGSPSNTAFSGDQLVQRELALQWFGGPGPQHMTDRHLRSHAPLAGGGRMFIPGENKLMAIDAFNGTKLWERDVPKSHRYSIPYDCGYISLDNKTLAIAASREVWLLNVATGAVRSRISLPDLTSTDKNKVAAESKQVWGYLASMDGQMFATAQRESAARTVPSRNLIDVDYRNSQPLVISRTFFALDQDTKNVSWKYDGTIVNTTICISPRHVMFLDGDAGDGKDRVPLSSLLGGESAFVCLDRETGREVWRRPVPESLRDLSNIVYVQSNGAQVVLSGSLTKNRDTLYRLAVLEEASGQAIWSAEHFEGKPGAFTHGEQVHHPVLLEDVIVAEPAIYRLSDGVRLGPDRQEDEWRLVRPGHSCGTLSAGGECLFFRATNPTVLSLSAGSTDNRSRMTKLAPSRPGCWINIIPAEGMVLIPEASASCVCLFSLQTSMGFASPDN